MNTLVIPATGHEWGAWKVPKKATALEEGVKERVCKHDAAHKQTQTIPATGFSGTPLATMTSKGSNSLVLNWTKIKGAEGYDIFFIECGKQNPVKVKTIKGNATFTWTKSKLKKNTSYKAYVRAWAKKDGKKQYISKTPNVHAYTSGETKHCTNAKGVVLEQSTATLKTGNTFQIRAKVTKLKENKKLMPPDHGPGLRYVTNNKKVATVDSFGKITAKGKGTCKIYVLAINGARKTVTVTVK